MSKITSSPITFVYDLELKQVGCALLQRAYGANIDNFQLAKFNNWLTHPTNSLKMFKVDTPEQLEKVIEFNNKHNKKA